MTHQVQHRVMSFVCLALFTLSTAAQPAKPDQAVQQLELGRPVERTITGGESHRYQFQLSAGQYANLVIDQRGIDVSEVIVDSSGQKVAEVDGPNGSQGVEPVLIVAAASGSYQLEVRVLNKTAPTGRYELKIEELRDATPQDRDRAAAQKALMEGTQLARGEVTAESRRKGIEKLEASIAYARSAGDNSAQALALHALGGTYGAAGDAVKALDFLNEAFSIRQATGDRRGEASTLSNIAGAYLLLGEYQKVVDSLTSALALQRATGDRNGQALVHNNICLAYRRLGEFQKALDHCNEALALQRALGNQRLEAENLNNIGLVYKSLEDYENALLFFNHALSLKRALEDRRGQNSTLVNIADVYRLKGDWQRALNDFNETLALGRALGDRRVESVTLGNIGSVHAAMGEPQKALDYFGQSLLLRQQITDRAGEAILLYSMAGAHRDLGNWIEAQSRIEAALVIVESLRSGVVNQELRESYFATVQDFYELYVDVLLRRHRQEPGKGFAGNALEISERARARGLLDLLGETSVDVRYGVDQGLLQRERSLESILKVKAANQVRLLSGKYTPAQADALAKEISVLTTEYEQVRAQIRTLSPRYSALTRPEHLDLKGIQAQITDDDTLLLEYLLGKEKSYLWAVTRTSLFTFELPGRAKIEAAVQRTVELLRVSHMRQQQREAEKAADDLSQMLLGPVAGRLGSKRLLVVADGILQYIPFAALTSPMGESRSLVVDHEIVNLPSVAVLAVLRREMLDRKGGDKMVAVLADPVLQSSDPRVNRKVGTETKASDYTPADLSRGFEESGTVSLERLHFSRREAEAILALSRNQKTLRALDFDANRATATSPELADYKVVHFATHGLINSRNPHLSGVVLSLVDKQGLPQDGFLRLHDIYNLKLGADLVVLSACQTALGRQVRGEGLVGLVRGFMYAGAPRVVASLWDVKDEATAELMKRFYEKMLVEKQTPAAALRAAQISLRKDNRWRAPYYWAGFTLQGEWK